MDSFEEHIHDIAEAAQYDTIQWTQEKAFKLIQDAEKEADLIKEDAHIQASRMIEEAEQQAYDCVGKAEEEADLIKEDAHIQASRMIEEAEQQAYDCVGKAEEEADLIKEDAHIQASRMIEEAEQQAYDCVGKAEEEADLIKEDAHIQASRMIEEAEQQAHYCIGEAEEARLPPVGALYRSLEQKVFKGCHKGKWNEHGTYWEMIDVDKGYTDITQILREIHLIVSKRVWRGFTGPEDPRKYAKYRFFAEKNERLQLVSQYTITNVQEFNFPANSKYPEGYRSGFKITISECI